MTYLVGANVLCEATKPAPNSNAIEWLRHTERAIAIDPIMLGQSCYTRSTVSFAEPPVYNTNSRVPSGRVRQQVLARSRYPA